MSPTMHRRWYWKVYLGVMAVLLIGASILIVHDLREQSARDQLVQLASIPLYVAQLVGLFGFVYRRRIGSPLLWKLVLLASIAEVAWNGYETLNDTRDATSEQFGFFLLGIVAAATIVDLPLLIALYVYAFRSSALWWPEAPRAIAA